MYLRAQWALLYRRTNTASLEAPWLIADTFPNVNLYIDNDSDQGIIIRLHHGLINRNGPWLSETVFSEELGTTFDQMERLLRGKVTPDEMLFSVCMSHLSLCVESVLPAHMVKQLANMNAKLSLITNGHPIPSAAC